jgi:hypothetical protein
MLPHPRIIPSVMFGHRGFSWGQCSLARCHIALTGVALQCMRMCVIDSGTWHVGQFCRSLYPGVTGVDPITIRRSLNTELVTAAL